jgi:hypothetical protein
MDKKAVHVKVTVLSSKGPTSLIVWETDEGLQSAFLPSASVLDGKVEEVELDRAQPYGEPWAKILATHGDQVLQEHAVALQGALRNHGIWTYEQLDKRPNSYTISLDDVFPVRRVLDAGRRKNS